MPSGGDAENTATQGSIHTGDPIDGQKSYRVILEDISSGIETNDSFAIKFSLLTKSPISKMKHVVRCLPAPVWSGQGRSRAEKILALIEEAGGTGSIVETGGVSSASPAAAPAVSGKPGQSKSSCRWCGFPMKEGETRCGFCMTAVGDVERSERQPEPQKRTQAVSRKRLICCAAALVIGIITIEILTR